MAAKGNDKGKGSGKGKGKSLPSLPDEVKRKSLPLIPIAEKGKGKATASGGTGKSGAGTSGTTPGHGIAAGTVRTHDAPGFTTVTTGAGRSAAAAAPAAKAPSAPLFGSSTQARYGGNTDVMDNSSPVEPPTPAFDEQSIGAGGMFGSSRQGRYGGNVRDFTGQEEWEEDFPDSPAAGGTSGAGLSGAGTSRAGPSGSSGFHVTNPGGSEDEEEEEDEGQPVQPYNPGAGTGGGEEPEEDEEDVVSVDAEELDSDDEGATAQAGAHR